MKQVAERESQSDAASYRKRSEKDSERGANFEGQFYHIPESKIGPKPVQQPRPPLYLAGFGQYTFDRIAKFADGWNPAVVQDFESFEARRMRAFTT